MTTDQLLELFYPPSNFQREILKLTVQFVGALIIARLTVRWALSRFKTEKLWERESSALSEILAAIREIEEVNHLRLKENDEEGRYSKAYLQELTKRDESAQDKLISVSGVARLVLQDPIRSVLEKIEPNLLRRFEHDEPWVDYLSERSRILEESRTALLRAARKYLRS